jgi:hypothetical protein
MESGFEVSASRGQAKAAARRAWGRLVLPGPVIEPLVGRGVCQRIVGAAIVLAAPGFGTRRSTAFNPSFAPAYQCSEFCAAKKPLGCALMRSGAATLEKVPPSVGTHLRVDFRP